MKLFRVFGKSISFVIEIFQKHMIRKRDSEMKNILILIMACVFLVSCVCSPIFVVATPGNISLPESSSASQPTITMGPSIGLEASEMISASNGGQLTLPDQTVLKIPADALQSDAQVSIRKTTGSDIPIIQEELSSVGGAYDISLGTSTLEKSATLEIPFDSALLSNGAKPNQVFLSYYDEGAKKWVYAGGKVDLYRNVVVLEIIHASWWMPTTWNWAAWIAVLNKFLKISIVDWIDAVNLLTDECPQTGKYVQVNSSQARNLVQGCVEKDDSTRPGLRVVNPKSIFFEIRPISGGNGYPALTMLAPGDEVKFDASTSDPSPLIIQAEMTQKSGFYLVIHMIITMLPGANQFGIQSSSVACVTERLADVSDIASAVESLLNNDGAAAAESISKFMLNGDAVRRFLTAADDCNFGPAPTWSFEGISQIGGAVSTIMSATDYIANYFAGNSSAQVSFDWTGSGNLMGAIAYTYKNNIWLLNLENNETKQITHYDENNENFYFQGMAWSPDGKWLAYSFNPDNPSGSFDIFMTSADGSDIKRVTTTASANEGLPAFGMSDELFFTRYSYANNAPPDNYLIKLDLESGIEENITKWEGPCYPASINIINNSGIVVPGWCGTGAGNSYWSQVINISGVKDIYDYYPGVFSEGPCKDQEHPMNGAASAHGSLYLAFIDSQDCFDAMIGFTKGPDSIYILDFSKDIPEATKIYTGDISLSLNSLDWSPDNQYIIFAEQDRGLWMINIHAGELKQISKTGSSPEWRP
jgi:WD40 repeat protein